MKPLSLYDPFVWHPNKPDRAPLMAQRILHYMGMASERLSELNRAFYQVIKGQPFVYLQGSRDRYAILGGFRKRHIEEIFAQTGWQITWPLKTGYVKVGTNESSSERPCYRLQGSSGSLRIAYAFQAKTYALIKITHGNLAEYKIQSALKGLPNLLCATDACGTSDSTQRDVLYQVFPLAGSGSVESLAHYIRSVDDPQFRELITWYLASCTCIGLEAMHRQGYFHLDMKPANVVVDHLGRIWVIDFGCTRAGEKDNTITSSSTKNHNSLNRLSSTSQALGIVKDWKSTILRTVAPVDSQSVAPNKEARKIWVDCFSSGSDGDWRYFAPERWMACYGLGDLCNGEKVDGWAMGVLLLELETGIQDYFQYNTIAQIATQGTKTGPAAIRSHFASRLGQLPQLQNAAPDSLWHLIQGLLTIDPDSRLSPSAALSHSWIQGKQTEFGPAHEKLLCRLVELVQNRTMEQWVGGAAVRAKEAANLFSPQQAPLPHFTDYVRRPQLEELLLQRLTSNSPLVALQGMGGVGKSLVALYLFYSEAIGAHFGLRLWFRSSDQSDSLGTQIQVLCAELGLTKDIASPEETLAAFHDHLLKQSKPYLVVFDNADDPTLFTPYIPKGKGTVLITTRNSSWANPVPVDVLTEIEAKNLINTLLQTEDPNAGDLARTLGCLPLGLVQACAYIRNQQLSVSKYLELLSHHESNIIQENQTLFGKSLPTSMGALWETTFETLSHSCPEALTLLDALAYLAPDNIPASLTLHLAGNKQPVIDSLIQYALLTRTEDLYSIHRLSQTVRRSKQDFRTEVHFLGAALSGFLETFEEDFSDKSSSRLFMPHGIALDEHLSIRPLPFDPTTQRSLQRFYGKIGDGSNILQRYKAQRSYYEKFLLISYRIEDSAGEATAYDNLGMASLKLGDYRQAKEYFQEGLAIAREQNDLIGKSEAYGNLGNALRGLNEPSRAIEYHKKGLEISRHTMDLEGKGVAYGNLGNDYGTIGQHLKAIQYHLKDLEISRTLEDPLGKEAAYINLGAAHVGLKNYREAIEYYQKALGIAQELEDLAGEENACTGLGNAHQCLGEHHEAIKYHQQALEIAKRLEDSMGMGRSYGNLAVAYEHTGEKTKAMECYQEAYDLFASLLGPNHRHTLLVEHQLTSLKIEEVKAKSARPRSKAFSTPPPSIASRNLANTTITGPLWKAFIHRPMKKPDFTWTNVRVLDAPWMFQNDMIFQMAVSPVGQGLASTQEKTICLWDPVTGNEEATLTGHKDNVISLAFSPAGNRLASGSHDKTVRIWDLAARKNTITLKGLKSPWSVAFDPDGSSIAVGTDDNMVSLWDSSTGNKKVTFKGHQKRVCSVDISNDGTSLASAGWETKIFFWDLIAGKLATTVETRNAVGRAIFSPDGRTMAWGGKGYSKEIHCWDFRVRKMIPLSEHYTHVENFAISPDGKTLASGCEDGMVYIWDLIAGKQLAILNGHGNDEITCVGFFSDKQTLASSDKKGIIRLWDLGTSLEF